MDSDPLSEQVGVDCVNSSSETSSTSGGGACFVYCCRRGLEGGAGGRCCGAEGGVGHCGGGGAGCCGGCGGGCAPCGEDNDLNGGTGGWNNDHWGEACVNPCNYFNNS